MSKWLKTAGWWYDACALRLNFLQDGVLLLVRLYWGWQLVGAGWGKLTNVAAAAQFFEGIGIPWPTGSAVLSGGGEFGGGLLLIAGLASRAAALVVLVNMTVALLTAHTGDAGRSSRSRPASSRRPRSPSCWPASSFCCTAQESFPSTP